MINKIIGFIGCGNMGKAMLGSLISSGEIKKENPQVIASEIYGLICSSLVYKARSKEEIDVMKLYKEFENTVIEGLKIK